MRLSIIIPTFNSSKVVFHALDSILNQTFGDYEVLVMDGGSTDGTVQLVKECHDERVILFSEPDKGIYDAMNKGILKSSGEWLYFLGSDDWLLNERVLETVFSRNLENVDVLYGEVEAENMDSAHTGAWTLGNLAYNRCHQGIFYKRKVFDLLGMYNLKYKIVADHELNLRWFLSNKIKHQHIPLAIAHYSAGGFSEGRMDSDFYKDYPKLVLKRGLGKIDLKEFFWLHREILKRK